MWRGLKVFLGEPLTVIFIPGCSLQERQTDLHQWVQLYADDTCKGEKDCRGSRASDNSAKTNICEFSFEERSWARQTFALL